MGFKKNPNILVGDWLTGWDIIQFHSQWYTIVVAMLMVQELFNRENDLRIFRKVTEKKNKSHTGLLILIFYSWLTLMVGSSYMEGLYILRLTSLTSSLLPVTSSRRCVIWSTSQTGEFPPVAMVTRVSTTFSKWKCELPVKLWVITPRYVNR